MKTQANLKTAIFAIAFIFLINFKAKAQFTIDNQLTCDIKITWEAWTWNTPTCNNCGFNTITVFAGTTVNVGCGNDICITVISVGGNNIGWYNHANYGFGCHGSTQWITGQSSTGECTGGWNASWSGTTWIIN